MHGTPCGPSAWLRVAATIVLCFVAGWTDAAAQAAPDTVTVRLLDEAYKARAADRLDVAVDRFRAALSRDSTNLSVTADLGYTLVQADRREEAAQVFARVAALGSEVPGHHAQLGYLLLELDRREEAAHAFERALELDPDDVTVALQLGYLLFELGRYEGALQSFHTAVRADTVQAESPAPGDAGTGEADAAPPPRERARDALATLAGMGWAKRGTGFAELYTAPVHQSRFSNLIVTAVGRAGVTVAGSGSVQAYAVGRVTRDTRSEGGAQPQIFSDNSVSAGLGLRVRPGHGPVSLYAELATALPFEVDDAEWTADHRVGAVLTAAAGRGDAGSLGIEAYVDAAWYARFENVIGYANLRPRLRLWEHETRALDLVVRGGVVADSEGEFYNNLVELAPGLILTPFGPGTPTLMVEYALGRYVRNAPSDPTYHDFRVTLVLSANAVWLRR